MAAEVIPGYKERRQWLDLHNGEVALFQFFCPSHNAQIGIVTQAHEFRYCQIRIKPL